MISALPLPCIACRKPLESAIPGTKNIPINGLVFTCMGNYGSGVFDPITITRNLVVNICDECLVKAGVDRIVAIAKPPRVVHEPLEVWDPKNGVGVS